jgi:hypothetical protein
MNIPRPTTGGGAANATGGNMAVRNSGAANDFLAGGSTANRAGAASVREGNVNAANINTANINVNNVNKVNVGAVGVGASGASTGKLGTAGAAALGAGAGAAAANANTLAARQNLATSNPARVANRQEWQGNRQQRVNEVRNQVNENHPRFDFWTDHPNWASWRINTPYRWATYAAVGGWLGYGATAPTSYSYGDNVYYSDNQVYYGEQPVATSEEYAQQAATLAASAPDDLKPENSDWLPLGVFAVTQDGQASGAAPTIYMQLALNKEGVIAGNLKNTSSGQMQTLEGMVDKKTQRVAWNVVGKDSPIMETGLSNLTQDTTPTLFHFADGRTQQWLLVRLEEPKQ